MKKEEEIVINKDNYKGYVELYKKQHFLTDEEYRYQMKVLGNGVIIFVGGIVLLALTAPFIALGKIFSTMFYLESTALIVSEIGIGLIGSKKMSDMKKEKYYSIKKEYPYIDVNIDSDTLEKALENAGIIEKEFSDGRFILNLKVDEYENYLKVEEVKQKYLEETKYDKYLINPPIEEEELEKVKVKIKSLTR